MRTPSGSRKQATPLLRKYSQPSGTAAPNPSASRWNDQPGKSAYLFGATRVAPLSGVSRGVPVGAVAQASAATAPALPPDGADEDGVGLGEDTPEPVPASGAPPGSSVRASR